MSTTQNATTPTDCTDPKLSVFIPRVFGDTREQIEEVAANVRMTKPGHVAKFVHYLGQLASAESGPS
mgnify:CR=1 FL=1